MVNHGVKKRVLPRGEGIALRDRLSAKAACLIGIGLLVPAFAMTWVSLHWRSLDNRANRAEARLVSAQRELANRAQRSEDLRDVEASLRNEMSQLSGLVDQVEAPAGLGISRQTVADVFEDLQLVNKDDAAPDGSRHYALEGLAGSIQLRGPSDNLTQIQFVGALQGEQAEASNHMLATLLDAAAPQWEAAHRDSWLSKLTNIEDDVRVYKDLDLSRVEWHWTSLDGLRLDVLLIEAK